MKFIQTILVVLVAGGLLPGIAAISQGKTITAVDCSDVQVQLAINQATNGDTVIIPPGSATWTICKKNLLLKGSGINVTTLFDGQPVNRSCLFVSSCTNRFVNISDLTLVGSTNSPNNNGWIMVGNYANDINLNFRIHDIYFTNNVRSGIKLFGQAEGCIDGCIFECAPGSSLQPTGISIVGDGDRSWTRPFRLGTTNTLCIEDCSFYWPTTQGNAAVDAYNGARYVCRFNSVTNTSIGDHGLDTGGYRSPHSYEFYGNTSYVNPGNVVAFLYEVRGGTGVIYSNTAVSSYSSISKYISLMCYRATGSNTLGLQDFKPWGLVTGTNPIDGNLDQYGYPAHDQVGYTSPDYPGGPQVSAPVYGWSNQVNGMDLPLGVNTYSGKPWFWTNHPNPSDILKEGRDYSNHVVMPGYTPLVYPHPLVLANL